MMVLLHRSSSTAAPDKLVRRMMQRAELRDGLPEVLFGFLSLFLAAQQYVMSLWRRTGDLALWIMGTVLILLFVCLCLASNWLLKWLRGRYLISRSGYVKPKVNRRSMTLPGGITLLIAAAFLFAMWRFPQRVVYRWLEGWFPIVMGAFICVLEIILGRAPRFWVTGALTLACGVLLTFSPLHLDLRLAVFFGFAGATAVVSGAIVLARFVRSGRDGE